MCSRFSLEFRKTGCINMEILVTPIPGFLTGEDASSGDHGRGVETEKECYFFFSAITLLIFEFGLGDDVGDVFCDSVVKGLDAFAMGVGNEIYFRWCLASLLVEVDGVV